MKHMTFMTSAGLVLIVLSAAGCSSGEESTRKPDPKQLFTRLDIDRDARISWDEYRDVPVRNGTAEERFQSMDKNQDGYVSQQEFLEARPQRDGSRRGGNGGGRRSW
jgi:Ca2+-binding EF-hand superfamily protein